MKTLESKARLYQTFAAAFLIALLSACASVAPTPEDILAERAQARWNALLANDYAGAYSYYSPGYRAKVTATDLEIKLRMQRVKWTAAKVTGTNCEGDACTVNVDLHYRIGSPVPGVDTWNGFDKAKEQWVKVRGEWWFVPPKE